MSFKFGRWILTTSLVVGLDQLFKFWFSIYNSMAVQLNPVGAGSFLWLSTNRLVWLSLTGVILIGMVVYLQRSAELTKKTWLAWALIWGGGASNWLDRLIWGGVKDIWPILGTNLKNNLADYALTVGVIWLMIDSLLAMTSKSRQIL
jgi:lipoprotein signal peptidase